GQSVTSGAGRREAAGRHMKSGRPRGDRPLGTGTSAFLVLLAFVTDLAIDEVSPLLDLVCVLAAGLLVDKICGLVERAVGLLLVLQGLACLALQFVESDHDSSPFLRCFVEHHQDSVTHSCRRCTVNGPRISKVEWNRL